MIEQRVVIVPYAVNIDGHEDYGDRHLSRVNDEIAALNGEGYDVTVLAKPVAALTRGTQLLVTRRT